MQARHGLQDVLLRLAHQRTMLNLCSPLPPCTPDRCGSSDIFVRLLSTAINGLHPTVLDPVVVVGDYRVELTWSLPLLS